MKQALDYSLTDSDIKDIIHALNPTVRFRVVAYDYVNRFSSINSLMKNLDALIILYKTETNYGHFTCLTKCNSPEYKKYMLKTYNKKTDLPIYCFFDPLGYLVDNELNFVDDSMKLILNEAFPHLRELLKNCPNLVEWSEYKVQSASSSVCGRFAALRACYYKMPLKTFIKMLDKK